MAITTSEALAERALNLDLLDDLQLQAAWGHFGRRDVELADFKQYLLRHDLLTNYQVEHLILGDRSTFHYGDYKVLYLIGTGTFARVYRAAHRQNNRQAAVKVLRKRFSEDAGQAQRFYREGKMGSMLKHPNIVPIWEAVSEGQTHYIVMEFIEGRNLREFARVRKLFEPAEATRIMLDVANGLDYAFQMGISHRDMKLSNVLVSSRGQAKLVDFGLAGGDASIEEGDDPNPRTIDYAGLERASCVRNGDMRSDIFFAGCMYYQLLTGQPPMSETRDRAKRLSRDRYRDIAPIQGIAPELPSEVMLVVNRAIEFEPDKRYQTPGELAAELHSTWDRLRGEGGEAVSVEEEVPAPVTRATVASGEGVDAHGQPRVLMIVEADVQMQNLFRERLKRHGYRVLVIANPQRALERFEQDQAVAQLVLFSTGAIGEEALDAFQEFGQRDETARVPSILLLDEKHKPWESQVEKTSHRIVMKMPVKLRQLRESLVQLLDGEAAARSE